MKFALIDRNGKVIAKRNHEAEAHFSREEHLELLHRSLEAASREYFACKSEEMKTWALENIIKPTEADIQWFSDKLNCIYAAQ